jgi:ubiquitin-activating enzyme E1
VVRDQTGEQEKAIHIASISQDVEGVVYLHEGKKHGLSDGDTVQFREVQGMEEINGKQFKIVIQSKNCFTIGDTR